MARDINTDVEVQRPEGKAMQQTVLTSTPQHQQEEVEEV